MADLHLIRGADGELDLDFNGSDLVLDDSTETATAISLLTWARRGDEDPDPTPGADRMGWWGNSTLGNPGDELGSKIWLGLRSKPAPSTVQQVETWAKDSLQWMIRDGVARTVSATLKRSTPPNQDRTVLVVVLVLPDRSEVSYNFELNWNTQTPQERA